MNCSSIGPNDSRLVASAQSSSHEDTLPWPTCETKTRQLPRGGYNEEYMIINGIMIINGLINRLINGIINGLINGLINTGRCC
jgi:hypothetical protein